MQRRDAQKAYKHEINTTIHQSDASISSLQVRVRFWLFIEQDAWWSETQDALKNVKKQIIIFLRVVF